MATYRAIQMIKTMSKKEFLRFASMFSTQQEFLNRGGSFFCLKYNPDVYQMNQDKISEAFSSRIFKPLVITNYKFLSLLLTLYRDHRVYSTDFSFTYNQFEEDGYVEEKDNLREYIAEQWIIDEIYESLDSTNSKIKYVDIKINSYQEPVRFYASGNIMIPDCLSLEDKNFIMEIVEFLFMGSMAL